MHSIRFEEGCDPGDELAELDALLERLRLKRLDLTRKISQSYHLSTSSGRYVDHFRILPTRFYGSSIVTLH